MLRKILTILWNIAKGDCVKIVSIAMNIRFAASRAVTSH